MGTGSKIILVGIFVLTGVLTFWQGPVQEQKIAPIISARDYHNFWLWPGNAIPADIVTLDNLYILQGEFLAKDGHNLMSPSGIIPSKVNAQKLWLVFRVEAIRWDATLADAVNRKIKTWEFYGNSVVGIQIDFDAKSQSLKVYGELLRQIRQQMPKRYQLSVTGLLDWSNSAYESGLKEIGGTVDEVIFQTYQGRSTISDYTLYLANIARLNIPFKIGLIEHGHWQPAPETLGALQKNGHFLGFVVFLHN